MLRKLSNKLTQRLVNNEIITTEEFDIYVYGFELLLSFLFSTSIILIVGLCLRCMIETIFFLVIFISLRSFTGGYHALTYTFCNFVTFTVYGVIMLLSNYLPISIKLFLLLLLTGIIVLIVFAPVKNPNKIILPQKSIQHKVTSILLFVAFGISGLAINRIYPIISSVFFYTLCADILLIFPKNFKIKERR